MLFAKKVFAECEVLYIKCLYDSFKFNLSYELTLGFKVYSGCILVTSGILHKIK